MTGARPLARIPRATKIAAVVLAFALLQVAVLAALGFGQNERRRAEAVGELEARAQRALRNFNFLAVRQVAVQEQRLRAELDGDAGVPAPTRARDSLRTAAGGGPAVFARVHILDAHGEPTDVERLPFDLPETVPDPDARRRVDALLAEEQGGADGLADRAVALADDLERGGSRDAVAAALALQCGARAAFRAHDWNRALSAARRLLAPRYCALRDDRSAVGETEPFGPSAALVVCEVLLAGLPVGSDADQSAFVDAVLGRRVLAQRLRGELSETGWRVERDDCRRLRVAATALRVEHQRRLDAQLAECDALDAALDLVRSAPRGEVVNALARREEVRLALPDGSLLFVAPLGGSPRWAAAAFTAPAERLRAAALVPEIDHAPAPEGAALVVRDASGAHVAGRAVAGTPRELATTSLAPTFPGLTATAVLADPSVIDRAADDARSYWLWVLGAAVLAVLAAGLLLVRAVLREVRLARMKSDFVSNLSHELRTPLTSLRMFVETLQEGRVRDEAEAKECLGIIAQETDRLASLVDRVLQFAAFARGRAPIQLRSGDAGEVVRRAVTVFRKRAEAAGARIEVRIAKGLPESILDRDAIVQVILNLLDNAVKHAGHDQARIRVTARPHPPDGGLGVAILVEDDGPGIPDRERELVFEEFYRGDDTLSRRTQGAGLGLALTRRIVLAHGGVVGAGRSADLGGAEFRIVLPEASAGRRLAVAAQQGGAG